MFPSAPPERILILPLFIDMTGTRVAVFGAGPVGVRKANYFAQEARVTVIGLDFAEGFDPRIDLVKADISDEMARWVEWADLVVAATNDHVLNGRIAAEAMTRGRPCNRADGVSTFLIPSMVERNGYAIAISTMGRSPGMSKYLRLKLERELGVEYDLMVRLQEEVREVAKASMSSQTEREAFLWEIMEDEGIWSLLLDDYEGAKASALARLVNHDGFDH